MDGDKYVYLRILFCQNLSPPSSTCCPDQASVPLYRHGSRGEDRRQRLNQDGRGSRRGADAAAVVGTFVVFFFFWGRYHLGRSVAERQGVPGMVEGWIRGNDTATRCCWGCCWVRKEGMRMLRQPSASKMSSPLCPSWSRSRRTNPAREEKGGPRTIQTLNFPTKLLYNPELGAQPL
jgi:hypothetical protein